MLYVYLVIPLGLSLKQIYLVNIIMKISVSWKYWEENIGHFVI